jgi:hypothetical protein
MSARATTMVASPAIYLFVEQRLNRMASLPGTRIVTQIQRDVIRGSDLL